MNTGKLRCFFKPENRNTLYIGIGAVSMCMCVYSSHYIFGQYKKKVNRTVKIF